MTSHLSGSLRRTTAMLVVALAVILNWSAEIAASAQAAGATPPACTAKPKGEVRYSDWQFPDTLNPLTATVPSARLTIGSLFSPLVRYDDRGRLVPVLLRQVPTLANGGIRDGGETILLSLRPGIRWSNGAEITSKDILFGWWVAMDPVTGPLCAHTCDRIESIETPNRYTAVLHMRGVYASAIPAALPYPWPHIWPGAWNGDPYAAAVALETPQFNFESAAFPTDGPYQVASYTPGDRIVLRPMRYYHPTRCHAALHRLTFIAYRSKAEQLAAMAEQQTDVTGGGTGYSAGDLPQLHRTEGPYQVHVDPGFSLEHIELNHDALYHDRPNPLATPEVRIALALAIDRADLVPTALGVDATTAHRLETWSLLLNTSAFSQPFADPAVTGQWDPIAGAYVQPGSPAAIADARTLLARAGYPDGFPLDVITTNGSPARAAEEQIVASGWKTWLNVDVNARVISSGRLLDTWDRSGTLVHGNFQAVIFSLDGSPDPDEWRTATAPDAIERAGAVHPCLTCANFAGIVDPILDAAFGAAESTFDPVERSRQYAIVQERMNQQAHWVPLYYRPSITTDDGRVAPFRPNPTANGPEWNSDTWHLASP